MLNHKLGVIWRFWTLYNRFNNIVDVVKEITHVNHALYKFGYPEWAFKKVKQQLIDQKAAESCRIQKG